MREERFYTLLASLPHLPYFLRAKRLPIGPVLLEKRIAMLPQPQRELSHRLLETLAWYNFSRAEKNGLIIKEYESLLQSALAYPNLHRSIKKLMLRQMATAAFRLRRFGLNSGMGEDAIPRDEPLLKVRLPWMQELARCMEEETPYDFALLMMKLDWKEADALAFARPFGFEAFAAYLIRWTILQMWLGLDTQKSANRFTAFTSEVVSDYKHQHPLFD